MYRSDCTYLYTHTGVVPHITLPINIQDDDECSDAELKVSENPAKQWISR